MEAEQCLFKAAALCAVRRTGARSAADTSAFVVSRFRVCVCVCGIRACSHAVCMQKTQNDAFTAVCSADSFLFSFRSYQKMLLCSLPPPTLTTLPVLRRIEALAGLFSLSGCIIDSGSQYR